MANPTQVEFKGKIWVSRKEAGRIIGCKDINLRLWFTMKRYFKDSSAKPIFQGRNWVYYKLESVQAFAKWWEPKRTKFVKHGIIDLSQRF